MEAVSLGPLVFSIERFAVVAGLGVFMAAVWWLGRRADERLQLWSTLVMLGGFAAARLGHVAQHWQGFAAEPWRVVAFWQGGFWAPAGFAAAGAITALMLWRVPGIARPAALSLIVGLGSWQAVAALRVPPASTEPPAVAFATLDGGQVDLSRRDGRPLVVNLWASWCAPCRREMPMMADVAAAYEDVDFVFANQAESAGIVRRFLAEEGLDPGIVLMDTTGALRAHYAVAGLPTTLFIDADGSLRAKLLGELSREVLEIEIGRFGGG
jgi:thiol-disulfide isomerase/thioredoxin